MATVTKTIGTTGRNYSTMTLWEADLDDTGIYTSGDDAVGEIYADSDFDEGVVIDGGGTVGLNSILLTVPSAERHDGTANSGARTLATGSDRRIYHNTSIFTVVEWFEIDFNSNGTSSESVGGLHFQGTGTGAFRNMLVHDIQAGGTIRLLYSRIGSDTVKGHEFLNIIAYDVVSTTSASGRTAFGVELNSVSNRDAIIHNCTIDNVRRDNATDAGSNAYACKWTDASDHVASNNYCGDATQGTATNGTYQSYSNTNFTAGHSTYNAAHDTSASGTGSIDSATATNQFVSIVAGSEDYHLKSGSDLIDVGTDLGTTPTNVNIDIDGRNRDAEGDTWDMGADEFLPSATTATPSSGIISLILNSPTIKISNSAIAEPSLANITVQVNTPTVSTPTGVTVTPSIVSASIIANTPTILKSKTITPGLASISFDVGVPSTLFSKSAIASPSLAISTLIVNSPTVLNSRLITPSIASASFVLNSPGIVISQSRIISPSLIAITLNIGSPTVSVSAGDSGITVTILLKSEIQKYIDLSSRINKFLTAKSSISKYIDLSSPVHKAE